MLGEAPLGREGAGDLPWDHLSVMATQTLANLVGGRRRGGGTGGHGTRPARRSIILCTLPPLPSLSLLRGVKELDWVPVVRNANSTRDLREGGQAEVYVVPRWQNEPGETGCAIADGACVAIKHIHSPSGGGKYKMPQTEAAFNEAGG